MKLKFLAVLFLGILSVQAQKLKKGLPVKKPAISQMASPKTTEGIKPRSFAATPLSKEPSSLEEPINTLLTADTLPRISSGVNI